MRRRRNPFARETVIPVVESTYPHTLGCSECGTPAAKRHPLYMVKVEPDGGRDYMLRGAYCSWSCAEAYLGGTLGR